MKLSTQFGACDCHSHVFGPFEQFPLSAARTFDSPESPIEELEKVWDSIGIDRSVLVQGSTHGDDHRALLAALARSPQTRRGVALLKSDVSAERLAELHDLGVRAVRFNWIRHLLGSDGRSERERLTDAAALLEKISASEWHVEIHIDIADLDMVTRLNVPDHMPVVIDHMARIDLSAPDASAQLAKLLRVLEGDSFWVKVSGGDRLAVKCVDLECAIYPMHEIIQSAPDRCVWGLDWPHVNLTAKRSDLALSNLLLEAAGDESALERVLIHNPAKLYGFDLGAG
jgi:predicted TIM-barrel fold metal-dependent hydrolase